MKRDFGGGDDTWDASKKPRTHWEGATTDSPAFEEYYRGQGICPPEEWDEFLACLRRNLPLTFRINGGGRFADALRTKLESDFLSEFATGPIVIEGEVVNPPKALPWYPHRLGWQMDFSRMQLRRLPKLEALHEFMKRETDIGAITRQEAVSMVPPLFLDVQPQHRVLDMCAAPGSKTAQLIEALHSGSGEPSGVVVANDADPQRCNMLTHQTQRMRSPAFLITNHEAQGFPLLYDLDPNSPDERILYDRILCDVPCSGDGTLRKQPDIWRKWSPGNGNGLHMLQIRITLRGCELLRVGGRMVYSTCTFNPIEDEAVVADVVRRTNGSMRLVDVSSELPELRRLAGLKKWRVRDRDNWYDTWEEGKHGHKLDPTMFPGPEDEDLGLEHCMRYLPHHQDTGGFFVAVLEKVAPLVGLKYPSVDHRASKYKGGKGKGKEEEKAEDATAEAAAVPAELEIKEEAAAVVIKGEENMEVEEIKEEPKTEEAAEVAPAAVTTDADVDVEGDAPAAPAEDEGKKETRPWYRRADKDGPLPKVLPEWGVRGGGARNRVLDSTAAGEPGEPGAPDADPTATGAAAGNEEASKQPQQRGRWRGIDPIVPFADPNHILQIRNAYGLSPDCPIPDSLVARSHEPRPKKLTYINSGCKMLLLMDVREQIKVTAGGLKMFERQENKDNLLPCCYRIAQEGLPSLLPYMHKQKFQPTVDEFIAILTNRAVGLPEECKVHITKKGEEEAVEMAPDVNGTAPEDAPAVEGESGEATAPVVNETKAKAERSTFSDPSTIEQLAKVDYGCCVATLRAEDVADLQLAGEGTTEGGLAANAPLAITCWRGRGNLNVLVSKQECSQMADRLKQAIAEKNAAAAAAPHAAA